MKTKTHRLVLKILATNFLLSLCLVTLDAQAQRQPRPRPPVKRPPVVKPRPPHRPPIRRPRPPVRRPRPVVPVERRVVLHGLNIRSHGQQTVALGRLAMRHAGVNLRGKTIKRVEVMGSSARGRGQVSLYINGQYKDSEVLSYYNGHVSLLGDYGYRSTPAYSAQLELRGNVDISRISIIVQEMRYRGQPGYGRH